MKKKNYWLDSELLLNNLIITVSCYSFSELLKHISWNHHSLSLSEKSNNAFRSYTASQNYKHNRSFIRHHVKNWRKKNILQKEWFIRQIGLGYW